MRSHSSTVIAGALLLMYGAVSTEVSASGFQLLEQNASGIANAYAGSAAVADNASTIFFNPAGMARLKGTSLSVGVTGIQTSYKFSNGTSSVGALATAGNGGDGGGLGVVPNGYIAWQVNNDVYLGLGVGAPFGLKTEYDNPWIGGAQSVKFDIKTINVNPSIAWRVNDQWSLGFGLDWQKFDAEYVRIAGIIGPPLPVPPLSSSPVKLKAKDDSWGWNAGLIYQASPDLRIGVSYRSQVKFDLDGSITVSGPNAAVNAAGTSGAKAQLKLPETFILSAVHRLNDRWEALADLSWTGWSSIPKLDIFRSSGALAQTLDSDFRDTWRIAGGLNYVLDSSTKLKLGVAYDQTPVRDDAHRLVSLPDNNRLWLSGGAQWVTGKDSTLDVGVAYLYIKDSNIHNNQGTAIAAASRGLVDGKFKGSAWLFGLQYSTGF